MEAIIDSLKKAGKIFYPKTKTKAVYDDNNNRLDNTLTSINDSLNGLFLTKTVTGTTDATGGVTLDLSESQYTVISASVGAWRTCIPITYNGVWGVRVLNNSSTYSPVASSSVTVSVTYIKK